jgi:preprotein translocase subunit SecB
MKHRVSDDQLSALQFERVWVREATFLDVEGEHAPVPPQDIADVPIHLEVKVNYTAQGDRAYVMLRASLDPPTERRLFLKLSAAVEGAFLLRGPADLPRLQGFATTQAPVLLVPYLRQVITMLTAQSRVGAMVLPPLNMVEITKAMRSPATGERVESPVKA